MECNFKQIAGVCKLDTIFISRYDLLLHSYECTKRRV